MSYGIPRGIRFKMLSDADIDRIHWSTLYILDKVGVQVDSQMCRDLLRENGCTVDDRTRVCRIPPHLVQEALRKKKSAITLAARNPKYDAELDLNHSYVTSNGNGITTWDPISGKRRSSTKRDQEESSRICDAVRNVHIHWPMVSCTDQHPSVIHLHDLDACLNNTEKHIMYETGVTISDAKFLSDMGYVAAGGEKEFRRRPICSAFQCTFAPLQHDAGVMEAGIEFARSGVPVVYFAMPQPGATGPVTLVGSVVVGNAEVLSALVITQLAVPGAAVIHGFGIAPMDMRATVRAGGSPEHAITSAMGAEIAHHYGMPTVGAISSTAKEPGDQACIETYTGAVGCLLAGADIISGIGLLEDSGSLFFEEVIIEDEIVEIVARLLREEPVNEDTLALDVIEKVGIGKNYLAQKHTLQHLRSETFFPSLIDRSPFEPWTRAGARGMRDKARDKVKDILAHHVVPPLEKATQQELEAIIQRAVKPMWGGESKRA